MYNREPDCLSEGSPPGSPSRGGDVAAYVKDINQPSLPTPFYSVFLSVSVFKTLSTLFHSINSHDNSPLSHCSSSLISALLDLSTKYLLRKVSLSRDIILCGLLGLKHQLTNFQKVGFAVFKVKITKKNHIIRLLLSYMCSELLILLQLNLV